MDFPYLVKVTKLNVAALAWLASAPPPPEVTVEGAVSTDTTIRFNAVPGADRYVARWRRTDSNQWSGMQQVVDVRRPDQGPPNACEYHREARPRLCEVVLKGIRVDDWVFGVSTVSSSGFESPVAAAVPGGAFKPYVAPPPTQP
jgi:hypothetical protein